MSASAVAVSGPLPFDEQRPESGAAKELRERLMPFLQGLSKADMEEWPEFRQVSVDPQGGGATGVGFMPKSEVLTALFGRLADSLRRAYPFAPPFPRTPQVDKTNFFPALREAEEWLQQVHEDHALMQLWNVRSDRLRGPEHSFATAADVRAWMSAPKNATALEDVFQWRVEGSEEWVASLNLIRQDLKAFPKEIGLLTGLEELYLQDNRIETIPPDTIERLPHLWMLDLGRNRIERLPPNFERLSKLRELILSGNKLGRDPLGIGALPPELEELYMSDNGLMKFPPAIGSLPRLKVLVVNSNHFATLPGEIIGNLKQLERILLGDNWLEEIPLEIVDLTHLRILCVSGNRIATIPSEMEGLFKRLNKPSEPASWLAFHDNPLLIVPVGLLSDPDFAKREEIVQYEKNRSYQGSSPMARLCLAIMHGRQEEIVQLRQKLSPEDRESIERRVCTLPVDPSLLARAVVGHFIERYEDSSQVRPKLSPEDRESIERRVETLSVDLTPLACAVASHLIEQYESLPPAQQQKVYERVKPYIIESEAAFVPEERIRVRACPPQLADALALLEGAKAGE